MPWGGCASASPTYSSRQRTAHDQASCRPARRRQRACPPVDLAERAWAGALARRRSVARRSLVAVAAGALAIAALPPLLGRGTDTAPSGMPSTSSASSSMGDPRPGTSAPGRSGRFLVRARSRPRCWTSACRRGLRCRTRCSPLTDHPISTVRAVLMTDAAGGGYHPVLVDPSGEYRIVADVTVQPTADEGGNTASPSVRER